MKERINYKTIEITEPRPGIVLATLDRPDRLNAITFEMFDELHRLCEDVGRNAETRVLAITGRGRGFCSGLDLDDAAELTAMSPQEMLAGQERWAAAIAAFRHLSKPVIAAVNGPAAGAGMALALAADVRLAVPAAKFNAAFVRIGLSGGDVGVSWMLPRIVGLGRAAEIMLTGKLIDATRAECIGLVNEVVDPDILIEVTLDLASEMAANSPLGMSLTKQVLQVNVDAPSLEAAMALENRNQALATRTEDMAEALSAFRERREPRFTNR
jgi:enoyl-CoA hydratase/carnithine racemase